MEVEQDDHLPLLGELMLGYPHQVLTHSISPRMDLACLVSTDPTATAGSAGGAGGAGAKLSAHQAARARLIAMARARAIGGAAAAAAAAAAAGDGSAGGGASNGEPKRGPSVLVSLFRMEGIAARVWQVSIPVQPTLFEALKTPDGKFVEEEESIAVGDVAWSPDGLRLALSLTLTRHKSSAAAGPSSQAIQSRHAHVLQLLSVQDGAQLSALATSTRPGPGAIRKLQWTSLPASVASLPDPSSVNNSNLTASATEPFSFARIHALPPLPSLDVAALEKVGTAKNSTMPHYMRAQQQLAGMGSAGAAAQQTISGALPSEQARLTGQGPLARLGSPFTLAEAYENGLIGGRTKAKKGVVAEPSLSLLGQRFNKKKLSVLCAIEALDDESGSSRLDFVLDGTAALGAVKLSHRRRRDKPEDTKRWQPLALTFSDDLRFASVVLHSPHGSTLRSVLLRLPFGPPSGFKLSSSSPSATHAPLPALLHQAVLPPTYFHASFHFTSLGSHLRLYLSNALDAASLCSKIWCAETGRQRPRYNLEGALLSSDSAASTGNQATPGGTGGTAEWIRLLDEAAKAEGVDTTAELLVVLLTGRANTATESLLLNTVTPGMLRGMETSSVDAFSHIRNVCADFILPACERVRLLLSEIEGCVKWSQRFGPLFADGEDLNDTRARLAQVTDLSSLNDTVVQICRAIAKEAERELLAQDEFYKWWRFERERQEYLRQHKEDPRLAIVHDVLTVSEFVQRGPVNPRIASYLDGGQVATSDHRLPGGGSSLSSEPSGLGIMMDVDPDQSAVLGPDGRVVQPTSQPRTKQVKEEASTSREGVKIPRPTLKQTLSGLKARVIDNRRLGSSISPRYPLATREQNAARMAAAELFAGPASDFGEERTKEDSLAGKTLEGSLWALTVGLADVVDTALQRTMPSFTAIEADDLIEPGHFGFGPTLAFEPPAAGLLSRPAGDQIAARKGAGFEANCLLRHRVLQLPEGAPAPRSPIQTFVVYALVSRIARAASEPPSAPQLVLLRQKVGGAETTTEAARISLPAHALAADFLSDETLTVLLPSDEPGKSPMSAQIHALDIWAPRWSRPFALDGTEGDLAIPSIDFEPHASLRLEPNLDAALAQLSHTTTSGAGPGGSSASNAMAGRDDSVLHSSRIWAFGAERATAMSMLPLSSEVVEAIAAARGAMGAGGHQRGTNDAHDGAAGRLMQYWDVTPLS